MKILGRHMIVEFVDCNRSLLNDSENLEQIINEAVRRSGATIVKTVFHRYNPHGVSGVVVIAESHFSIHTWPEYGYAAVDFFTCGDQVNANRAFDYMKEQLDAQSVSFKDLRRGIPSISDETLEHKPSAGTTASAAQAV